MFEFIFGIFAIIVIVTLAIFDSKRNHSDRYDLPPEDQPSLEPLLGVIYPEKDTNDQKDKNA
jgi:hypothetical protein